ncbi:MAG: ribonuclease HII [Candidatus Microsaccharimonas sp.]
MILGIDEVGRGPWAGPLVVGAVVLGDTSIDGLTDSKKLSKKKREILDVMIRQQAHGFGLGWVHADEIDQVGLVAALRLATIRAVEQVKVPYHEIIIDGTINFLSETNKGRYVTTLPKGDMLIPAISAASIIAKVARDAFMTQQDQQYPGYNFTSHVGYGTAVHRDAIDVLGVTPLHRRSFAPIANIVGASSTKAIGDKAEEKVTEFLQAQGHMILERNWRTKFCEIDIVSQKGRVVYFTEVKYRRSIAQGDGMAAITPAKLKQMKFAVEFFVSRHKLDVAMRLCVASVSGDNFTIDQFLELE